MPVFMPEPTSMGSKPKSFLMADFRVEFKGGTTEEMIPPVISDWGILWISRTLLMLTAYSKSVFAWLVVTRSTK